MRRSKSRRGVRALGLRTALIVSCCLLLGNSDRLSHSLIFLPGTQPGTVDTVAAGGVTACAACHSSGGGRVVRIRDEWAGTMMAHSARDPVFYAALAVANKYAAITGENTGEFCIRCHSPTGWLAGRSEDVSGRSLRGTDIDGVQCDHCHRMVDPLHPDSTVPSTVFPVPGYGNGMNLVQASTSPVRGPRDASPAPHATAPDTFQSSAALCGVCHDVSNPFHTRDQERIFLPPHEYAPLERTYSEWLMSAFSSEGPGATCQGCHMPAAPGYAASNPSAPERADVRTHDLTGGNTFVPLILPEFWPGLDTAALGGARDRAAATLRRAAMLSAVAKRENGGWRARVRITNLTGHKLPTGYPEGRRMWLSVTATGEGGDTLFRSGVYDTATATLVPDTFSAVYEAIHGVTDSMAGVYGIAPGPTFLFSVNDTILFDNRIPPRGFTNDGFSARLASPVGASYPDGVHWDEREYPLPEGTIRVSAALWYQTMSREYATFLRDENAGNPSDWNSWGEKLYDAWERHGKSSPALIDSIGIEVNDSSGTGVPDGAGRPVGYRLDPAYPNPFNSSVTLRIAIPAAGPVRIEVVDMAGRTVAVPTDGRYGPGDHTITFSAPALPSGTYIVRMTAGPFSQSRKILLIR